MRRKALISMLVSGLLVATVFVGIASAHVAKIETSLRIGKSPSGQTAPGDRVLIFGKLKPRACRADQTIVLLKVQDGPDAILKHDTTDADGEYSFRLRPRDDMTVYTKFYGSVDTSYGHSHTCLRSRSSRVSIGVTG